MYPKVKVREEKEEADQYAYEKSSLQSLKAFQWLSLADRSSSSSSGRILYPLLFISYLFSATFCSSFSSFLHLTIFNFSYKGMIQN